MLMMMLMVMVVVMVMMAAMAMVMVMMLKRAILFRHRNDDLESLLARSFSDTATSI